MKMEPGRRFAPHQMGRRGEDGTHDVASTEREEALEVGVHDTSTVGDSSTVTWRGTSGPGAPPSDEVGEPTAPDECASSGLAPEVPGSDPPSAAHPPADDALREEET